MDKTAKRRERLERGRHVHSDRGEAASAGNGQGFGAGPAGGRAGGPASAEGAADGAGTMVAALCAQQHLLQAVLDQVPIPVAVKGPDRRYLIVNRSMAGFWGVADSDQVIGQRVEDLGFGSAEDRARIAAIHQRVLDSGEAVDVPEMPFSGKDGQTIWRHLMEAPLRDDADRVVGIIGVAEDITARRAAAAELTQMAEALSQAGDAVFITDLDGIIRYVNAAFERITGYRAADAIGQTPRLLKSGLQPPQFYADVWGTLQRGEIWKGRYTNRRKDGTIYHTHSTHSPIRDAEGRITGYLSVQRDVTQQVELDERLLRSQRLEALGTLAGGIAHDFNNVLLPIMGYTELLRREVPAGSRQAAWLQVIAEASQRARDLVARILLFTRQSESRHVPMRLEPVIQEVLGLLRSTVPATIHLRAEVDSDEWILGDPAQMHQVLMNLCVNAVQAMPEGGELTLAVDVTELSGFECYLGQELTGRHLRLKVADTGVGMDPETLSHIFEPFFTTKAVGQGTGLGLSTVFGIVRAHAGALRVQSAPGAGSTFELYFPVTSAPAATERPHRERSAPGTERVLVVDDEPAIAELTQAVLDNLGYRVTALTSSLEALARLAADPGAFDAVVTDQTMPGLTGEALAERLRSLNPSVPIVLCTGLGSEGLHGAVSTGVITAVVHKPYRPSELAALLRQLLDRR
jgi:PAS domain S-box-containing protein